MKDRPFYYDKDGTPIGTGEIGDHMATLRWSALFENYEYRKVERTDVGERWSVSTLWFGTDMGFGFLHGGPPLIFETAIVDNHDLRETRTPGVVLSRTEPVERYATLGQAEAGHARWVASLERGEIPPQFQPQGDQ